MTESKKLNIVIEKFKKGTSEYDASGLIFRIKNTTDYIIVDDEFLSMRSLAGVLNHGPNILYSGFKFKVKLFFKILFKNNYNTANNIQIETSLSSKVIEKNIEDLFFGLEALGIVSKSQFYTTTHASRFVEPVSLDPYENFILNKQKLINYINRKIIRVNK